MLHKHRQAAETDVRKDRDGARCVFRASLQGDRLSGQEVNDKVCWGSVWSVGNLRLARGLNIVGGDFPDKEGRLRGFFRGARAKGNGGAEEDVGDGSRVKAKGNVKGGERGDIKGFVGVGRNLQEKIAVRPVLEGARKDRFGVLLFAMFRMNPKI